MKKCKYTILTPSRPDSISGMLKSDLSCESVAIARESLDFLFDFIELQIYVTTINVLCIIQHETLEMKC